MDREALASLLDRIGDGEEAAYEELLAYIRQQSPGIQALALEALEDGGDDTFDQLMLTLAYDPHLVIQAPRPYRPSLEPLPEGTHLIAQQADREWQARHAQPAAAPRELLGVLQEGSRGERIGAARALGEFSGPETVAALLAAIRIGDRMVAAAAVEALQTIGTSAVPALLEAITERGEQVRWHAAKALSTVADERAIPALIRALEDGNYGTRWLAAEGLVHVGRPALVPLLRHLAENKTSAWLRQGTWHVLNKLDLPNDTERQQLRVLADELKRASTATIPDVVRRGLRQLGEGG